jgi:hypothetical protein
LKTLLATIDFAAVVGGKVKGEGLKELKNPFPYSCKGYFCKRSNIYIFLHKYTAVIVKNFTKNQIFIIAYILHELEILSNL